MLAGQKFYEKWWQNTSQALAQPHLIALKLVEKGPVLDLGCGDGLFLQLLKKEKNIEAVGVDISQAGVAKAQEKGGKAMALDLAGQKLPFADQSFETVSAINFFEHLFNPLEVLLEATRVGKKIVIVSPNFAYFGSRLKVLAGGIPRDLALKRGHVFYITRKELKKLTEKAGLTIEKTMYHFPLSQRRGIGKFAYCFGLLWPSFFATTLAVRLRKA